MAAPQYVIAQVDENGQVRPVGPDNPLKISGGGGGGGAVDSVNGQTGEVVLSASDVNALPDTYTPPAPSWASVTGKPATFTPSAHSHAAGDIDSGTFVAARIPSLAISKITGLQAALDLKANVADIVSVPAPPAEGEFTLQSVDGVMSWVASGV